ncbi:MAG: DegV family protein [Acidimicrobiales bacterium]
MPGIQVVTDSASDLPEALVAKHNIEIVPLTIRFGNKEFVDQRELTPAEFWKRCAETSALPETAAPSPGAFQAAFEHAKANGKDGVVCVNISSGLSGTLQSATVGAAALPEGQEVRLVDSTFASMAQGLVVLAAAEAASAGASLDGVESVARSAIAGIKAFFTLDTLENLRKGGRIGNARALIGGLLSIKPTMENRGGVVELVSRQRTRSKALSSLIDVQRSNGEASVLAVSHGDATDIDDFLEKVSSTWPRVELIVSLMGSVLGTHLGKGSITLSGRFSG